VSTEIFYFSGTGNSLHAARGLAKRLPDSRLVPIARELRGGLACSEAETVGLVFPSFCQTIPIPLFKFLRRADFSSAAYIFALCTRGGSSSTAFDFIDEILRKKGKRLNAGMQVTMAWNDPVAPAGLTAQNTPEYLSAMEERLQVILDGFSRAVMAREDYFPPDDEFDPAFGLPLDTIERWFTRRFFYKIHEFLYPRIMKYEAGADCKGCGVCEKVCPAGKIGMEDGRPCWNVREKCWACFACVNFCPQQAIQIPSNFLVKSATAVNGRYHHPGITWKDIAAQR